MKKKLLLLLVLLTLNNLLTSCTLKTDAVGDLNIPVKDIQIKASPLNGLEIMEDQSVYDQDQGDSVKHLYLTIPKANTIENGKNISLKDLMAYRKTEEPESPKVEVVFQEGSPEGPQLGYMGYGARSSNATLEVRGKSSTTRIQKSLKIRLYDKAGLWDNQRIINLNKHAKDLTRVRNKVCFDLFKTIPNFTSMRTQFINLHIKDLSSGSLNPKFEDYGLYTHIENPNKSFLKSHGLDPNGNLYKVEYFEFFRYPDLLKLSDNPTYNKKEFESILEINGSEDHRKLLQMLDDVNDYTMDINDVIDKHFNRDNMLTWLSVNLLLGNIDTNSNNFMLYSGLNSDTWYFMPWDYDVSLGIHQQLGSNHEEHPEWKYHLSNYWGMVLFNRFFKVSENVEALNQKIEEVYLHINKEKIQELLVKYHEIPNKYVSSLPDLAWLPSNLTYFEDEYQRIAGVPEQNLKAYYENLEYPMPFYLDLATMKGEKIEFNWEASYDLQSDNLTYDFYLSTDLDFTNILVEKKGITDIEYKTDILPNGLYYWRVIVNDSHGNQQIAFDIYNGSSEYPGLKQFSIEDGMITNL